MRDETKYVPSNDGFTKYNIGKVVIGLPGYGWVVEETKSGISCSLTTKVRKGKIPDINYQDKTIQFTISIENKPIICSCGGFVGVIEKESAGNSYTYFLFPDRANGGYIVGSMKGQLCNGFYIDSHDLSSSGIGEVVSMMIFESITLK